MQPARKHSLDDNLGVLKINRPSVVDELTAEVAALRSQLEGVTRQKKELERILDGVIESKSWKITAPLRAFFALKSKVFPLTRNRRMQMALVPIKGLAEHDGTFSIMGPSSSANLEVISKGTDSKLPNRWVRVVTDLRSNQSHRFFFLYYSSTAANEDGTPGSLSVPFSPADRVWLTCDTEKTTSLLVRLPDNVTGLRLDPFDTNGEFSFPRFEIVELGSLQVAAEIFNKQIGGLLLNPRGLLIKLRKAWSVYREGGFTALRIRLFADNFTSNYQEWVRRFDTLTESDRKAMRAKTDAFALKPLMSVLMPTYNTPERWLRKAIESVRAQTYEKWELCIADDASSDPSVRTVLEEFAKRDSRIKFVIREKNGHIAAASQSALEMVSGEFIALLDHDDELAEHALWTVVEQLNRTPNIDLFYSDEDKLTSYGMRFNPHFKSGWNPELFLAQNYICHLGVYRTAKVREVGGFRCGFEGAQDWDLAWRVIDSTTEDRICHIPHVLYHWRVIEGSTAQSTAAKPYVLEAQRQVIVEHLERTGVVGAEVEVLHDISHQRVRFPVPEPQPLVTIIIPTKDQVDFLKRTIDSIIDRSSYRNFEIIVVDNRSNKPETQAYLDKLVTNPSIRVLVHDEPFNFARINNIAVREARGELVAFLNNDLEVIAKDWLEEMVSYAVQPQVGAVGARLWYPNFLMQHGGVVTGIGGIAGHSHKGRPRGDPGYFNRAILPQAMSGVTAACLVMRRSVFDQVNGFDEENFAVAFNDVDFCLRIRKAGYRCVYNPYAELFHHESISRGYENTPEKFQRFVREMTAMTTRWGKELEKDPYYNPNLTLLTEDFTFAFPPRVQKPWL